MPKAPRKPCRYSGCKELVTDGYCGQHKHKQEEKVKIERIRYDNSRGTASERGYDSRWTKYSKIYRMNNPLCVRCSEKGKVNLAECVDHIKPVENKNDPLFWLESNHQSLCNSCHSEKTAKEDGGFSNRKIERFCL